MDEDPESWTEIHGFRSPGEYQELEAWLAELEQRGVVHRVVVTAPYAGSSMFVETWYRTTRGETWRVVAPEAPFAGLFARVSEACER